MKKMKFFPALLFLVVLSLNLDAQHQMDSLQSFWFSSLRGRIQTGNLDQFVIANQSKLFLGNKSFDTEWSLMYEYVKVRGFVGVNDFWTYGVFRLKPRNRFYPMAMINAGFAKSFHIESSYVGGAGAGCNVLQKGLSRFLQVNLFGGYMRFDYEELATISTGVVGVFAKGRTPLLSGKATINWEFNSYLTPAAHRTNGFSNLLLLEIPLVKHFSLTLSHNMIYNHRVSETLEQLNTFTLFGLLLKSK